MQNAALKVFSDRARASALAVRRHQDALGPSQQPAGPGAQAGGLSPAIAARVKEILAAKQKGKAKAGGKGKKGPDPAKAKAKAEREKAAAAKKQEREQARVERAGKQLSAATARETAKRERVAAQAKRQVAQQKKLKQAAQAKRAKGKASASAKTERAKQAQAKQATRTQAAKERLAKAASTKQERTAAQAKKQAEAQAKQKQAASDRAAKQTQAQQHKTRVLSEKIKRGEKLSASDQVDAEDAGLVKKAGKALDMSDDLAIKAGARHSKLDMDHIQGIHDHAVAAGAQCDPGDDETGDEAAGKAIKGIMDNPQWYASHECNDIMQASSALQTLAMLIQSELSEEDEDDADISQLCDAAETLLEFIQGELKELSSAASDAADGKTAGDVPMAKAIGVREDVNPKAGVAEYGSVAFADAKNKKYPIDTEDHIRAAWNYISKDANAAKYDPDEVAQIKAKIVSAWKKTIDKAGPPSAGKAVDDAWLHIDGGAIKAADGDTIGGLAVLYATKSTHDLEKDFYDKDTDLWLNHWGWPRPITYHHGMDAGTRDDPVIGHWTKATVTDEGVWLEGQLDRAHRYYKAVKELARRGYLKISSDSGPQWVIREPQSNGANYIKRWPLVTASVTVTPMEPRMFPVEVKAFLAELGYEAIENESPEAIKSELARHDDAQASDERARRLLLELDILQLEETAL